MLLAGSLFGVPDAAAQRTSGGIEWPMYRFDLARTGHQPDESILSPRTVGALTQLWSAELIFQPSTASPIVADGYAYVQGGYWLDALDAASGAHVWKAHTGHGFAFWSTPAEASGFVYVGAQASIRALDAATGGWVWERPHQSYGAPFNSPAVDHDLVIDTGGAVVQALDAATGDRLWSFRSRLGFFGSPAIAGGVVFAGGVDGHVYALDERTGGLLWDRDTGHAIFGTLALAAGVVYASAFDGWVLALDQASGTVLWSKEVGGIQNESAPAVAYGSVFVGTDTGLNTATFSRLDAATGRVLWRVQTRAIASSPAVANGVVYVGTRDGTLNAFSAATGRLLWQHVFTPGLGADGSPVVAAGVVYETTDDGHLYAFGLPT